MYRFSFILLFWLLLRAAVASPVNVAVAASVQPPFLEIAQAFQRATGVPIDASFGSSGKLVAQIMHGAPFDVLLSADTAYPDSLYRHHFAASPARVYALGSLVLWTVDPAFPLDNWQEALRVGKGKIAIANPQTAPFGREAIRALEYYRLLDAVRPRLVYGDSIAQTSYYVESGVANVGLTSRSIVLAPGRKQNSRWIDIPEPASRPIPHGVVLLSKGKSEQKLADAQRFIDFLFTPDAQEIWRKFGYTLANK